MADIETSALAPQVPTFKKRNPKTTAIRKRSATPPHSRSQSKSQSQATASDSDSSYTSADETGSRVKRRKKEGVTVTATKATNSNLPQDLSKSTAFVASREKTIAANEDATKTSNWYNEAAVAAAKNKPAFRETPSSASKSSAAAHPSAEANPSAAVVGPTKAPTNVRMITVTDFAPDVCKDYKQTGFCGFGDGCKFLHAREDYKQGWQLDKEWEKVGTKSKSLNALATTAAAEGQDDEAKLLETIPFACVICKGEYKLPVVTRCGHYFCEKCAMQRYMREKKRGCAICGQDTNGTFNVAKKLKGLLERKRVRVKERREAKLEAGEEVSEDEDGEEDGSGGGRDEA